MQVPDDDEFGHWLQAHEAYLVQDPDRPICNFSIMAGKMRDQLVESGHDMDVA